MNEQAEVAFWNTVNITWLRFALAWRDGYLILDGTPPKLTESEENLRRTYSRICHERKIPYVTLACGEKTCELLLDFDSAQRGPEGQIHPLPPEANAEIDALLKQPGYQCICWSEVIKKYARIPFEHAHELACSVFRIAKVAARTPVRPGEYGRPS